MGKVNERRENESIGEVKRKLWVEDERGEEWGWAEGGGGEEKGKGRVEDKRGRENEVDQGWQGMRGRNGVRMGGSVGLKETKEWI